MKYTNNKNIPLPLAVWLATDTYEYSEDSKTISATSLLKSARQLILQTRLDANTATTDIADLTASHIGTAIHESIEKAWATNYKEALTGLGYPTQAINNVSINSDEPKSINIITEKRLNKSLGSWNITGCPDFIYNGSVYDFKSTKVNTFLKGNKYSDYQKQLSIYRWMDTENIVEDTGYINYIFTDWSFMLAEHQTDYPKSACTEQPINLLSLAETEEFMGNKISLIEIYYDSPEPELPLCTDAELWRSAPVFQYFSSPDGKRASKNFDNYMEANSWALQKGKGLVRTKKGKAMACLFCPCKAVCSQYQQMYAAGEIVGQ